ncbi:MAG TPA: hypothetical protein VH878_06460 [Thermodesulfobacteriota bacterium]
MRSLKVSFALIFLLYLVTCGSGAGGGGTKGASINLLIQLPEEFFTDSSTELSSEQIVRQIPPPNFDGAVIELMVSGDDFETIKETIPVSTNGPTQKTVFVPAGTDRFFEALFIDGNGILMAICSAVTDIIFGVENDVALPCSAFVCTECDDPVCEGERCDFEDETKVCIDGQCVTPTPPPTPTPTPTPTPSPTPTASPTPSPTPTASPTPSPTPTASPTPSPTPTPTPKIGCCEIEDEGCFNSTNLECDGEGGHFFPSKICSNLEGGECVFPH